MTSIYLDNNSTSAILPEVASAMTDAYQRFAANPASQHRDGQRARAALEDAREEIAEILGLKSGPGGDRLILTSGATESNNLALFGMCSAPGRLIVSSLEHPSCLSAAESLQTKGISVHYLQASSSGEVDLTDLRDQLEEPGLQLVSVMMGNNETGVLQPLPSLIQACQSHDVPVHSDAVQVVGKLPIHFRESGLAAMSFSAHKLHGPIGIGGLALRSDVTLRPLHFGGSQQGALRPGTESVALAIGMAAALRSWHMDAAEAEAHMRSLREQLEATLLESIPGIRIHGVSANRLPHTSCISFPGVDRQALVLALDLAGVACSTGSACTSGSSEPSPALLAMGVTRELVDTAVRFSLSRLNKASEMVQAADCILRIYKDLQPRSPHRKTAWATRQQTPETL